MHAIPYAAWAALVTLVGTVAPGLPVDAPVGPCEAPHCIPVTHAFIMSAPLAAVAEGAHVEWRAGGGHHWFVESGTGGGCLAFTTSPDSPAYRVRFLIESGRLYAAHRLADGRAVVLPCEGAMELPNGSFALPYQCQLHAREGGVGLLLVASAEGLGPPPYTLP